MDRATVRRECLKQMTMTLINNSVPVFTSAPARWWWRTRA